MAHVVQVVYTPVRGGDGSELVAIRLPDRESVRHYLRGEAPSAAVCLALEAASRSVARDEVPSGDGFTVTVVFVNEAGEPLTPVEPMPPEQRVIQVPADHPAWNAIDDDDWNGHTFGSWLRTYVKGATVVIWPPHDYGDRLGRFLAALLNAGAERIVAGAAT